MNLRRLDVALAARSYPILIGAGLLRQPELIAAQVAGRHVLVVSDSTVAPLYAEPVQAALAAHAQALHIVPAGESNKTWAQCARVFEALTRLKASRDAAVIALGGGVIGDLAGFAAACWMRGVTCVQLPTTLLAMVDSSVGGKTAVNLPEGKNLVGAFHQPAAVIADTDTLATLPSREYCAGLAEVAKYGAIRDPEFLTWIEAAATALLARDTQAIGHAIELSCRHKAEIVARDEFETGERALLNFGHTFGHALETATGYGVLLHGEAVAIGMVLAAELSARLGLAPAADAKRLRALLARLSLPVTLPPDSDPEQLLDLMRLDKKASSGRLRLILWRGIGRAEIADAVPESEIRALLVDVCAGH
jgi:3-dehydroquinate synthase